MDRRCGASLHRLQHFLGSVKEMVFITLFCFYEEGK